MKRTHEFRTADEAETMVVGAQLADLLRPGQVVYLSGDLGAGKTTLVRGLVRALGHQGRVKSPSYGLIESYELDGLEVHHLDLYRLGHGEEILYLGLEDLQHANSLLLVEWAERGAGWLPSASWQILIQDHPEGGRQIKLRRLPDPDPAEPA